jgi:hypothetical protein
VSLLADTPRPGVAPLIDVKTLMKSLTQQELLTAYSGRT